MKTHKGIIKEGVNCRWN